MYKLKLGFDIDHVINLQFENTRDMIFSKYGIKLKTEMASTDAITSLVYDNDYYTNKSISDDIRKTIYDIRFQCQATPSISALRTINSLKENGAEIYFITSRRVGTEKFTIKWLNDWGFKYDYLYHTGINGKDNIPKGIFANELCLDFFIDDRYKNIVDMQNYRRNWNIGLYLIDRPWNIHKPTPTGVKRIKNFVDVLHLIKVFM